MLIPVLLSLGALNALVPVIIILILIAAAAGLSRGTDLFALFGVGAMIGMGAGFTQGRGGAAANRLKYNNAARKRYGGTISNIGQNAPRKINQMRQINSTKGVIKGMHPEYFAQSNKAKVGVIRMATMRIMGERTARNISPLASKNGLKGNPYSKEQWDKIKSVSAKKEQKVFELNLKAYGIERGAWYRPAMWKRNVNKSLKNDLKSVDAKTQSSAYKVYPASRAGILKYGEQIKNLMIDKQTVLGMAHRDVSKLEAEIGKKQIELKQGKDLSATETKKLNDDIRNLQDKINATRSKANSDIRAADYLINKAQVGMSTETSKNIAPRTPLAFLSGVMLNYYAQSKLAEGLTKIGDQMNTASTGKITSSNAQGASFAERVRDTMGKVSNFPDNSKKAIDQMKETAKEVKAYTFSKEALDQTMAMGRDFFSKENVVAMAKIAWFDAQATRSGSAADRNPAANFAANSDQGNIDYLKKTFNDFIAKGGTAEAFKAQMPKAYEALELNTSVYMQEHFNPNTKLMDDRYSDTMVSIRDYYSKNFDLKNAMERIRSHDQNPNTSNPNNIPLFPLMDLSGQARASASQNASAKAFEQKLNNQQKEAADKANQAAQDQRREQSNKGNGK